jgi:hypothetical protein
MTIEISGRVIDRQIGTGAAGFRVEMWDRPSKLANQSHVVSGIHQHFFTGAAAMLTIDLEDTLIAYAYLDPSEVMLQWNDDTWEHRAYREVNNIDRGVDGTQGRAFMRTLPSAAERPWLETRPYEFMPEDNDTSDDRRDSAGSKGGVNG